MKSATLFFDKHTLRKDITRFSPVWLVYFIGGILVMLALTSSSRPHHVAETVSETLVLFSAINMIYAALVAQLLFGDLFNSRLCNALHALPLRREQWFVSHVIAGLCFSLVPNALGILLILPRLAHLWCVGLLWLLGMTLQYLFFFGLAVFSVFCTGNRFAMAAVYTILNFASILTSVFIAAIYQPLLFGIRIDTAPFAHFSPICFLLGNYQQNYVLIEPIENYSPTTQYAFEGLGNDWPYLWIVAAIGIVLLILSVLMYRRRALESAGDFIAVRPLAPVFSIAYTLTIGVLFSAVGDLITGDYIVFLLVGIVVGYFTGQIMLQRTVKIFKVKIFLKCGAVLAVLLISMLLTWLDPLGITKYVPEPAQTQQVEVELSGSGKALILTETEDIQKIIQVHESIIKTRDDDITTRSARLHLCYTMSDGRTVMREYEVALSGILYQILNECFSAPEYVLSGHNWEEDPASIFVEDRGSEEKLPVSQNLSLLAALTADCEAGNMAPHYLFHKNEDIKAWITVYTYNSNGGVNYQDLRIYENAKHTIAWLKTNGYLN